MNDILSTGVVARNSASRDFFERESIALARGCAAMAGRFARGGRLLAFGSGQAATDAQHVAVEFVHPVIVGKRALPALDVSLAYHGRGIAQLARGDDIVMGFAPPEGDADVASTLCAMRALGALTFALPGNDADYACSAPHSDPFIQQELIEVLYHTLWESVHVFLEHAPIAVNAGPAAFLYPFLEGERGPADSARLVEQVAASIGAKARDVERLREQTVEHESATIISAAKAMHDRIAAGGTLLIFGNGGSATDAADWALDCAAPPKKYSAIPAISLSSDAATLSAIANDIAVEAMFLRQIIAFGGPRDVGIAISTSGASANVLAALAEARKRGLLTVALVGNDGGEIVRHRLADFAIIVRSDYIPRIQEVQASIYHLLVDLMAAIGHPA